jgi:hypothetical protein
MERLTGRRFALSIAAFAVIATLGACGSPPPPPSTPGATSSPTPEASVAQRPADIDEAIAVRERYGLRADEIWVRAVATDPRSVTPEDWGIPLLPDELGDLLSRRWSNDLLLQVRDYGLQFPDDFATAAINQKASGVWVAFTANLERHRAALATLPLDGPVEVRHMQWSLKDLEHHLDEIKSEKAWIESLGAEWVDPVVYELENRVVIRYEGPEGLEGQIESHFGSPAWLLARWEGPGEWKGPRGDLLIQVRDAAGRPVRDVWCELISEDRRHVVQTGDISFGTGPSGDCAFPNMPAIAYLVRFHEWVDNDHHDPKPFAEVRFRLTPAGATVPVIKRS